MAAEIDTDLVPMAVYLIRCRGYFKVGVSMNPHERLKHLQTSNPLELKLYRVMTCGRESIARQMERAIHEELDEYRVRGEWFSAKGIVRAKQCFAGKM